MKNFFIPILLCLCFSGFSQTFKITENGVSVSLSVDNVQFIRTGSDNSTTITYGTSGARYFPSEILDTIIARGAKALVKINAIEQVNGVATVRAVGINRMMIDRIITNTNGTATIVFKAPNPPMTTNDTYTTVTGLTAQLPSGSGGSGAAVTQIDTFTTTRVWTKPAGAKSITVVLIGGGGGGGSGRKGLAGSNRGGGAGGGGGARTGTVFNAALVPSSLTVTVGAGGAGGAAQATNSTNGNNGSAGNPTQFGSLLLALGGPRGNGGGAAVITAPGTASAGLISAGGIGGQAQSGLGGFSNGGPYASSGGGGGGSIPTGNTNSNGGDGDGTTFGFYPVFVTNVTGGVPPGGAGQPGTATTDGSFLSVGGGGGASSLTAGAGAGGAGALYGSGGGGGGASVDSTGDSGAGGKGGGGFAIIITNF